MLLRQLRYFLSIIFLMDLTFQFVSVSSLCFFIVIPIVLIIRTIKRYNFYNFSIYYYCFDRESYNYGFS